jgi:long-chain acyl-CoA synthetase
MAFIPISEIDQAVAGQTAPRRFLETVQTHGDLVALRAMAGDGPGAWDEWTYRDEAALVARAAAGLRAHGLGPGQRVLLMMRNRPDFHWFDIAAQFLRATPVSIYNSSSPEEIQYLAHHAEAEIAILEDAGFLTKLLSVRADLPALKHVFVIDPPATGLPEGVQPAADLLEHGALDLDALGAATEPADLATLIYTSGTTGPPKGVMISQYNVVYTAEQLRRCLLLDDLAGRRLVSYLPMAHIAERMTSHYQAMLAGYTVTCCPEPTKVALYTREVHPEVMFGVPRIWEKFHAGVYAALAANPDEKAKFDEAVTTALAIKEAERNGTATPQQLETWKFLDGVAFARLRAMTGLDCLVTAITGAAPLPRSILEWYNAVGIPLSEIYGMSESSGPMTWTAYDIKPGTVGPAIPGCEVRIADDGEIVCRGGNVFVGYYRAPDKTAETVVDGWLHTGDIGVMDDDGYVKIVDRKKELIITSGGKNISPANLEGALKTIPLIGQACAIGDNRKYVSALLVLDPEVAPMWAKAHDIDGDLADLAADPRMLSAVQAGVDEINQQFAQVEQIKRFTLLGEEWLPDTDVMTPTSKLKRRGIHARYATTIDAMYDDE